MQTNGTLIDRAWCDLFREWSVGVGISLDGPAEIHDRHRKHRSGRGTHRDVLRGVARMRDANLPFHAIAVVTVDALDRADAILDFFEQHGIGDLAFNVEELEGANRRSSLRLTPCVPMTRFACSVVRRTTRVLPGSDRPSPPMRGCRGASSPSRRPAAANALRTSRTTFAWSTLPATATTMSWGW